VIEMKLCRSTPRNNINTNEEGVLPLQIATEFMQYIYRMSQEEWIELRESVPYVEPYRYNPKHLYPKLNEYGDNGQRSLKLWQLLHTY